MYATINPRGFGNESSTYYIGNSAADQELLATLRTRQDKAGCNPDDGWRMTEHQTCPVPRNQVLDAEMHVCHPCNCID